MLLRGRHKVVGGRSLTASQIDSVLVGSNRLGEVKPRSEANPGPLYLYCASWGCRERRATPTKIDQTREIRTRGDSKSQKRSSQKLAKQQAPPGCFNCRPAHFTAPRTDRTGEKNGAGRSRRDLLLQTERGQCDGIETLVRHGEPGDGRVVFAPWGYRPGRQRKLKSKFGKSCEIDALFGVLLAIEFQC